MSSDLETDAELARRVATTAGVLLLTLQRSKLFNGKALGEAGDRVANAFILQALAARRPDDAVLSEEAADDAARCARSRVWIVDPLDGTREFSEGRSDWAVHIGLAVEGRAVAGAVALPAEKLTFGSDTAPTRSPDAPPLRMVVSRTRPPAQALAVAQALGAELVPMGSAGVKAMAIVRGQAQIYLHAGGQYEWDNCAPVAVALGAGLHASRLDGAPLIYNRADPYMPDLLICRPQYADRTLSRLAALAALGSSPPPT